LYNHQPGKGLIWSRDVAYSEEKTLRVVPSGSLIEDQMLKFEDFHISNCSWNSKVSGHQLSRTGGPTE